MKDVIGIMKCKSAWFADFKVRTMKSVKENDKDRAGWVGIKDSGDEYHVYCKYWDFEPVSKWSYLKGSEKDFEGAPEWATVRERMNDSREYFVERYECDKRYTNAIHKGDEFRFLVNDFGTGDIIAQREPITECTFQDGVVFDAPIGMPLNEFKCRQQSLNVGDSDANINGIPLNKITTSDVEVVKYDPTKVDDFASDATINKYTRDCKGVQVDVYDVLQAFNVTNPALQHLIKKALCVGIRGHKTKRQDLQDIIDSAIRAKELEQ